MEQVQIKISRELLNDYVFETIGLIDPVVHSPEDLRLARQKLLEMAKLISVAPIDSKNNLPRIGIRKN